VLELLLHADQTLIQLVATYGTAVYIILFAIVFAETGIVVTPFLPGDSLLFATGALCATGALSTPIAVPVLIAAAFLGDAVNYSIGRNIGPRVFSATDSAGISHRLLNRDHLRRAHEFFEKYGGKAVIMGRFVPIVRTFVPFVAGAAAMRADQFGLYNIVGAVAWVTICLGAGLAFGNVPIVKQNFSLVTIGIVLVSLLPMMVEYLRHRAKSSALPRAGGVRKDEGV
jgi:membrane-associated protein